MQATWNLIYPYTDYEGIRLNAAEDYLLQLENNEDWVAADGEASGGERQTAALTLRIALASILAPGYKVLFLDEPTHNLDTEAIHDLADTIRSQLPQLMDQVFLITHEEALDEAATGSMHRLQKKTTENGLTQVETTA
jgi:DNA repair exonuclease SbcCD ATPase subunit